MSSGRIALIHRTRITAGPEAGDAEPRWGKVAQDFWFFETCMLGDRFRGALGILRLPPCGHLPPAIWWSPRDPLGIQHVFMYQQKRYRLLMFKFVVSPKILGSLLKYVLRKRAPQDPYYKHVIKILENMIRKNLNKKTRIAFSALPSINTSRQSRRRRSKKQESSTFLPTFFRFFLKKYWRRQTQMSSWKSFPSVGAVLWNLLCTIDWDPQSTYSKLIRNEPPGSFH